MNVAEQSKLAEVEVQWRMDGQSHPPDLVAGRFEEDHLREVRRRVMALPIVGHLGMEVAISAAGMVEASLPSIEPFHLGGHEGDALNGAIILSLLYCAIVCPGVLRFAKCATLQFDSRMLKPVLPVNVKASGYAYSATRKMVFCKAIVSDVENQLCAVATGIVVRV